MMYTYREPYPNELMHYGIEGMKWGVRRFQNEDGTWTTAGRERYGGQSKKEHLQQLRDEYRNQGHSDLASRAYARIGAHVRKRYEKKYNRQVEKLDKYEKKAGEAEEAGKTKKAEKFVEKAMKKYEKTLVYDEVIKNEVEAGKAYAQAYGGLVAGNLLLGLVGSAVGYAVTGGRHREFKVQAKEEAAKRLKDSKNSDDKSASESKKAESSFGSSAVKNAKAAAEKYMSSYGEHVGKLIGSNPENGTLTFLTDNGYATVEVDKNGKPFRVGYDD